MSGWELEAEYLYPGGLKKQRFRTPEGKSFAWRHKTPEGWRKGRGDAPHALYRASGGDDGGMIFCVEGEKDADTLKSLGYTAVSGENGAGPGKWLPEYTEELRGEIVAVLADNDQVGREYAEECARALDGAAASVRLVHMPDLWPECPEHGDITDMVVQLGPKAAIARLWERLRSAKPYAPAWPALRPFDNPQELPGFPVGCRSKVGRRAVKPEPVGLDVRERYREFVEDILAGKDEGAVELSPEADAVFTRYREYVERKLGADWEDMRDWGGKLCGAAARIAALLHLSENPAEQAVEASTMERAIAIARALEPHAEAAYGFMEADEGESAARYVLKRVKAAGKEALSRSELTRLCRKLSPEELDAAAGELEARGYLRQEDRDIGYNGRTETRYSVNPEAWN